MKNKFREKIEQTVFIKHDANVIVNHIISKGSTNLRYNIELPFNWNIERKNNYIKAKSKKWGIDIVIMFNNRIEIINQTEMTCPVAEFAVSNGKDIPVTKLELEGENFQDILISIDEKDALTVAEEIQKKGYVKILEEEKLYWQKWIRNCIPIKLEDERIESLYRRSYFAIKSSSFNNGTIMAGDRDYYLGVFARDSLAPASAMSISGWYKDYSKYWDMLLKAEKSSEGGLYAAYTVDGTSWNKSIEIDQYAMIGIMLYMQYTASGDITLLQKTFPLLRWTVDYYIKNSPEFLRFYRVYDEWFSDNYTSPAGCLGSMYTGLCCIAEISKILKESKYEMLSRKLASEIKEQVSEFMFSVKDKTFCRGLFPKVGRFDITADSYLLHLARFAYLNFNFALIRPDDLRMIYTVDRVKEKLLQEDNTLSRHEKEPHTWAITTLWLAQYYFSIGEPDEAMKYIRALAYKNENKETDIKKLLWYLPEQWNYETGEPWRSDLIPWAHGELLLTMICGILGYRVNHEKLVLMPDLPQDISYIDSFIYHMGEKVNFILERDGDSTNLILKNYHKEAEIWVKLKKMGSYVISQYFDTIVINGSRVKPDKIRKIGSNIYAIVNFAPRPVLR